MSSRWRLRSVSSRWAMTRALTRVPLPVAKGQRFGPHNPRHSLSDWLVNKAKVDPKTAEGLLRHSKIQTKWRFLGTQT